MRHRIQAVALALILLASLGFTDCGQNQEAARRVSAAQLQAQESFRSTLTSYFTVIENFTDAQLGITLARVDELTANIRASYARTLRLKLEDTSLTPDQREALIAEVAKEIDADSSVNEQGKFKIAALVVALKEKHRAILADYGDIVAAQQQLDQYIQLKRVDEVLVARTLDIIKTKTAGITSHFGDAVTIMNGILGLLPHSASKGVIP
jgi:hypothetical protein